MKIWYLFLLVITIHSYGICAKPKLVDQIVAIVDQNIILNSEVNNVFVSIKHYAQKYHQYLPNDKVLKRKILNELIMNNILIQLAQHANLTISKAEMNNIINNLIIDNNLSKNKLQKIITDHGINYHTYIHDIYNTLLQIKLRNYELNKRINVFPQEVDSLATQLTNHDQNSSDPHKVNISQIFIPLTINATKTEVTKAQKLASMLFKKALYEKNFNQLVTHYLPKNKLIKTSNLGWQRLDNLPKIIANIPLDDVTKGKILKPIRSNIGLHIFKINNISTNIKLLGNEVHIRHILLHKSVLLTDQQVYNKLQIMIKKIKHGLINFSKLAQQFSEDYLSANQGGDIGWHNSNDLSPYIAKVIIHMKKGEISNPIHANDGWHIIQLIDKRKVNFTNDIQKKRAYNLIFQRKFLQEELLWRQEQRLSTYIKLINQ